MAHDHTTDSSGVPWEGREFHANPHAGDDGQTPEDVAAALLAFRDGSGTLTALAETLATSRALIPLVTHAGDDFDVDNPVMEDKVQELAVVTLAGPNGEKVFPAFTSVDAMRAWNPIARPVPIELRRVCLAAAGEGADRVVVNPGTDQIVLRRPLVWTIAQGNAITMPWDSVGLLEELRRAFDGIDNLQGIAIAAGDPTASGNGPDVRLVIGLSAGLDEDAVKTLLTQVHQRAAANEMLVNAVESVEIQLLAR
jgi:hypothetical protein